MCLKSYILLLLLGLSFALPQEAVKAQVQKEKADPKVDAPLELTTVEPVAEPVTELEVEPAENEVVDEEIVEKDPLTEGKGIGAEEFEGELLEGELLEGELLEGEEIKEGEIVPEEEVEYTCEYIDSKQTAISIKFEKDEGVEHALEIEPVSEFDAIDEKLKECLSQDLTGRRNIKRRRRPGRRGGGRRRGSSAIILRELRRKLRGNPKRISGGQMKGVIRLAQRYVAAKGKESRRRRIQRRKAQGRRRKQNRNRGK